MRRNLADAFALGGRDAYLNFSSWCDDLEHRMMVDWMAESGGGTLQWLEVREAALQGWENRRARAAEPSEGLLRKARELGENHVYQRYPSWSEELEYRLQSDWRTLFGGIPWSEVREAVKEAWTRTRRENALELPR